MKNKIYAKLSEIIDPEVGFDIVSLGLIYGISLDGSRAIITMTLSTKSCPLHELILDWVRNATLSVEGVSECDIDLVWEPEWNISMASDEVKARLG